MGFEQHFISLDVSVQDRIAIITLNRPESRNALSKGLIAELGEAFTKVNESREIRAVIITGAGDRAFCAGADLKERKEMPEEEVHQFLDHVMKVFTQVDSCTKPVLACINGAALGGGLELALACDFRIMSDAAIVGLPEVLLGIIPGAGGTQRITKTIGPAKSKELILFAKKLSAKQALDLGIVSEVVQKGEDILKSGLNFLKPLVEGAPVAISAALDAIDFAKENPLREGLQFERDCYNRTLKTKDRIEALNAFAEKRKPVFRGC